MRVSRAAPAATSLFISAKTTVAIPATCPLVRDALIQATLDPSVRTIEFLAQAWVDATPVDLNAIVIVRDDGSFVLDVVLARPVRDVEQEGLALIAYRPAGVVFHLGCRWTTCNARQLAYSIKRISIYFGGIGRSAHFCWFSGRLGNSAKKIRRLGKPDFIGPLAVRKIG
jgi:hypothetical protein